ncbi:hypothetical protein N8Z37_01285 [Octadecabacter sp.]|nr:hypothetical protein [Octadecabacter sp.]
MKVFDKHGELVVFSSHISDAPTGLGFFSDDSDFIQVGTWRYDSGTHLPRHRHLKHQKIGLKTQECVFVFKGKIRGSFYDEDGAFLKSAEFHSGCIIVSLGGGHAYDILEDDTIVLETKNGPYFGPEIDRLRY